MGGDTLSRVVPQIPSQFQSTPPVWVVTHLKDTENFVFEFQSTPPVWVVTLIMAIFSLIMMISIHTTRVGGDLVHHQRVNLNPRISIHTTRVGGDTRNSNMVTATCLFQSTPPVWVVTLELLKSLNLKQISIHTTRVGGDFMTKSFFETIANFNPHHPCGW